MSSFVFVGIHFPVDFFYSTYQICNKLNRVGVWSDLLYGDFVNCAYDTFAEKIEYGGYPYDDLKRLREFANITYGGEEDCPYHEPGVITGDFLRIRFNEPHHYKDLLTYAVTTCLRPDFQDLIKIHSKSIFKATEDFELHVFWMGMFYKILGQPIQDTYDFRELKLPAEEKRS